MKKRLIISVSIIMAAALAMTGVNYLLSLHKVTFTLNQEVTAISVYNSKEKRVGRLASSGEISLQEGEYYAVPEGERLATDKITFTIEKSDKAITVNPPYEREYLDEAVKRELPAIDAAITAKYPSLISGYTLKSGTLYGRGEWFGGLLAPKVPSPRSLKDPYRIVLHKKDGSWEVIRRPEYVLTSSRYNEVPVEILRQINTLTESLDS